MDDRALVTRIMVSRLISHFELMALGRLGVLSSLVASVKQALLVTVLVAVLLILKVLYDTWRKQRHRIQKAATRFGNGDNLKKRIEETLQEDVHECPICLSEAEFPVMTDCGHIFCCACIIRYWNQSKSMLDPCDCAYCRCTFYKFHPVRWPSPETYAGMDYKLFLDLAYNKFELEYYNRRFSIEKPTLDIIQEIPDLILKLSRDFRVDEISQAVHEYRRLLFGTYSVMPEIMYKLIVLIDDCLLAFLAIAALIRRIRNYMDQRQG